jgi:hypothetical protein
MTRKWQPRELRLISEFVAQEYTESTYQLRVRLGKIQPRVDGQFTDTAEERMLGVFRRWADAIVYLPDRLILIEAAIRPDPGKISQLELYERLIPNTPELQHVKHLPVEKLLLYAIPDHVLIELAREHGITCRQYRPPWIEEYLAELFPRERRSPHTPL